MLTFRPAAGDLATVRSRPLSPISTQRLQGEPQRANHSPHRARTRCGVPGIWHRPQPVRRRWAHKGCKSYGKESATATRRARLGELDMVRLLSIASLAQELNVSCGAASASANWNDVIKFQSVLTSTFYALSLVASPDEHLHIFGDLIALVDWFASFTGKLAVQPVELSSFLVDGIQEEQTALLFVRTNLSPSETPQMSAEEIQGTFGKESARAHFCNRLFNLRSVRLARNSVENRKRRLCMTVFQRQAVSRNSPELIVTSGKPEWGRSWSMIFQEGPSLNQPTSSK